jgi:two-component system, NarL family, response regulator NreC
MPASSKTKLRSRSRTRSRSSPKVSVAWRGHLDKPDRPLRDRSEEAAYAVGRGRPRQGRGPEQKVRVLVVDDDPDFVEAAKVSLAADRRIEVVGGAASGDEAVRQAAALRPEVVAMDVVMPGLDGLEATRLIRKDQPECRVVLVSGSIFVDRGDEGLEAARAAGASAYVVKSRAVLDLAEVVVSVARSTGNMSTSSD